MEKSNTVKSNELNVEDLVTLAEEISYKKGECIHYMSLTVLLAVGQ